MDEVQKEQLESLERGEGSPTPVQVLALPNGRRILKRHTGASILERRRQGRLFIETKSGISEWQPVLKLPLDEENESKCKNVGSMENTESSHHPSAEVPHSRSSSQTCTTLTTSLSLYDKIEDTTEGAQEERTRFLSDYFSRGIDERRRGVKSKKCRNKSNNVIERDRAAVWESIRAALQPSDDEDEE